MITREQIEHLAKLAKLDLLEEEVERYGEQMTQVLAYFKQFDELEVGKVQATDHVGGLLNIMRSDTSSKFSSPEDLLEVAPEVEAEQIKVKVVVTK